MKDLKLRLKRLFKLHWPILLIFLVVFLFFWKFFIKGLVPLPADFLAGTYYPWLDYKWGYAVGVPVKNPITTDVVSFTYPMQTLAIELLKSGTLPLWNPYILAGTPLFANFQSAPFAINNIFYFLTDTVTGWSLKVISQHLLAALFTYLLLTHWKINKFASAVGGIIFAFAGFNLIWSQWNVHALAASFIPLLILAIDKFIERGKLIWGVLFSLLIALKILSGYPQIVFYAFIAGLVFWLFKFERTKEFLKRSVFLLTFSLVGLILASIQILPAWELLNLSQREVELLDFSWAFLPWSKVVTFLAPDYFGNHATQNYWGPTDYTTTTGFVGVTSFILSGVAYPLIKRKKEVLYALVLGVVSLILAFPTPISVFVRESGIFGLQAASAHRSLVLFNFSIAILAAFGLHRLLEAKEKVSVSRSILIPAAIILLFGSYSVFGYFSDAGGFFGLEFVENWKLKVSLRNMVIPTGALLAASFLILLRNRLKQKKVIIYLLLPILLLELFRFGWKFTPFSPRKLVYPKTPVLELLTQETEPFRATSTGVIPINMKMEYGIESLEGYDAIYPVDIAKFIAVLNSLNIQATPQGRYATVANINSPLLNLVNTKYFLGLKVDEMGAPDENGRLEPRYRSEKFEVIFEDKTVVVLENKDVLPRAFVVYDWEVLEREKILGRLLENDFPLGEKLLLEESVGKAPLQAKGEFNVEYRKYTAQKSILDVESDNDGMLFISDLYYPGWEVYVDGDKKEIYKANYAFRAVPIKEGKHFVEFIYDPKSFRIGIWLSASAALFLAATIIYEYKIKKSS